MTTTIQVSKELVRTLAERKMRDTESYEDIIWDLVEDSKRLNARTLKEIEISEKQLKAGKGIPFSRIRRELNL